MPQKDFHSPGSEGGTPSQGAGMPEHTAPSGQVAAGTATDQTSRTGDSSKPYAGGPKGDASKPYDGGSKGDSNKSYDGGSKGDASKSYDGGASGESGESEGQGMTATMTRQATEIAGQAKDMAAEYGQKIQDSADMGKEKAAMGLESAADQLRERVGEDGVQGQVGTKVADGLEKTATYLRDHDTSEIWSEIESFVKDHPLQAAAGALFAGFMMGRVLR